MRQTGEDHLELAAVQKDSREGDIGYVFEDLWMALQEEAELI